MDDDTKHMVRIRNIMFVYNKFKLHKLLPVKLDLQVLVIIGLLL